MASQAFVFQSIAMVALTTATPTANVYQSILIIAIGDDTGRLSQLPPMPKLLPRPCCFGYLDNTGANDARFPMEGFIR